MANVKTCSSCGADSDLICDVCMFCKKPLDRVDMNTLSNEDLIHRTSEWIEKSRLSILEIPNPKFTGKIFSTHTPSIEITNGEIRSFAGKYLSTLLYRTSLAPELLNTFNVLNSQFLSIKPKISLNKQSKALLILISLMLMMIIPSIFMFRDLGQKEIKEGTIEEKEAARIERVIQSLESLIAQESYEEALIMTDQIHWQYSPSNHVEEVKQTDVRRESLKKSITEMMNKRLE